MPRPQRTHIEGFTLSELLLAVALVVVLAAIAFPSLMSAQSSLRMTELDNAASRIASAAQLQMTAKKNAGTWHALMTEDGGPVAQGQAAKGAPIEGDIYYLTADQARDDGILPSLSLDEGVREGNFVIEFNASTATVVSVFYTDGKAGFFDSAHPETDAAQVYYDDGGSRDRASRMEARPMIGYYEGTPAGATSEVALANPVIWVDDQGKLCIQNPNLTEHGKASGTDWFTSVSVTIAKRDGTAAFVIGGLDESAQTFTVGLPDGSAQRAYTNTGTDRAFTLAPRTDASSDDDVFKIDLNDIARIVGADAGAGGLAAVIGGFAQGDSLRVDAEVEMTGPSVPSTATAFIEWPARIASLAVYVTDPAPEADESGRVETGHIEGTYTAPTTDLQSEQGTPPVTDIAWHDNKVFANVNTTEVLAAENGEASRQAYAGGWVSLSDAASQRARVRATVGSYASAGTNHRYQITEVWVNDARVGYLKQNVWVWESGDTAAAFRQCLVGLTAGTIDAGTSSLTIDARLLAASGIPQNEDGGYGVYVRTAPRSDEVQTFFTTNRSTVEGYLFGVSGADSRGVGGSSIAIRNLFENEFGAPSTVASWHATTQAGTTPSTATTSGAFPPQGYLRVYYSSTPAIGWLPSGGAYSGASPYTALPNAVLWLFNGGGARSAQPAAFVRDARTGSQDNYSLEASTSSTFQMPANRDELFFRVIEYCDSNGTPLSGYDLQYVPYTSQFDAAYATVRSGPTGSGSGTFAGWTYAANSSVAVSAGSVIGSYDASLAFGYVQLRARYQSADSVGLMYLEFDASGNVTGYYGSLGGESPGGVLPGDNVIASWGYYVVVPAGAQAPWYQQGGDKNSQYNWASCSLARRSVTLMGSSYDIYVAPATWAGSSWNIPFKAGSSPVNAWNVDINATPTYEYSYSFDFAAAVAAGSSGGSVAAGWGSSSSPWIVRHSQQFLGCMSTAKQQQYAAASHVQTHDLDMSTNTVAWGGVSFSGSYEGNNYAISGFALQPDRQNAGIAGFFRTTSGATLRNIRLVDVRQVQSSSEWTVSISGGLGARVGLLVGQAQDTTIEGCTVSGRRSSTPGVRLSLFLSTQTYGTNHVGALVGYASSASGTMVVRDCMVDNVSLVLVNSLPQYSSTEINLGGLVGCSERAVIDERGLGSGQAAVSAVHLELSAQSSTTASLNMGGLVGRLDMGSAGAVAFVPKLPVAAITGVDLVSNVAGAPSSLYVGAIIGKTAYAVPSGELSPSMFNAVRHNGTVTSVMIGNG